MVEKRDAEHVASLAQFFGRGNVRHARQQVARWMVVRNDDGTRTRLERFAEHLAGIDSSCTSFMSERNEYRRRERTAGIVKGQHEETFHPASDRNRRVKKSRRILRRSDLLAYASRKGCSPTHRARASAAVTCAASDSVICHIPTLPLHGIGRSKHATSDKSHQYSHPSSHW